MIRFKIIDLIRGTNIVGTFKYLEKIQYLDSKELQNISQASMDKLLRKAKEIEFYENYSSYDEFPILSKSLINKNSNQFYNNSTDKKEKLRKKTGGSTGEPFVYYTSKESQSYLWGGDFTFLENCRLEVWR